jgi:hypothetical protein
VNANLKRVESAKALPDFSFGYFNQSLIGSPIDAMAPIWQQPKSLLRVHVGIAIPLF